MLGASVLFYYALMNNCTYSYSKSFMYTCAANLFAFSSETSSVYLFSKIVALNEHLVLMCRIYYLLFVISFCDMIMFAMIVFLTSLFSLVLLLKLFVSNTVFHIGLIAFSISIV